MIGDRIRDLLKAKSRNASDLARFCEVSPQAANQWVKNEALPRGKRIDQIAAFFGITPQELEYAPVLSLLPIPRHQPGAMPTEVTSRQTAELIIATELSNTPRSVEYTQGLRDRIVFKLSGIPAISSFVPGTCQADAYEAGQMRGECLIAIIQTRNACTIP